MADEIDPPIETEEEVAPTSLLRELGEFLPELNEAAEEEEEKLKAESGKLEAPSEVTPESEAEVVPEVDAPEAADDELTKLREETARLTAEIESLKKPADEGKQTAESGKLKAEAPPDVLADVSTAEALTNKVALAQKALRVTQQFYRRGTPVRIQGDDGETRELTEDEIDALDEESNEVVLQAPHKQAFLGRRAERTDEARRLAPEFYEGDYAEKRARMAEAFPSAGQYEDADQVHIALVLGFEELQRRRAEGDGEKLKAESGKLKAEAKPPVPRRSVPIAPHSPGASSSPNRVSANGARRDEAREALIESGGGQEALERFLAASE